MNWTKEKPTRPGRYRTRNVYGAEDDVYVRKVGRGFSVEAIRFLPVPLSEYPDAFQWLGPLDAEREAAKQEGGE